MAERDVQEILIKLERLDEKLQTIITQGADHEKRLRAIENRPSKRWDSVVAALVSAVVGGMVTLAITNSLK